MMGDYGQQETLRKCLKWDRPFALSSYREEGRAAATYSATHPRTIKAVEAFARDHGHDPITRDNFDNLFKLFFYTHQEEDPNNSVHVNPYSFLYCPSCPLLLMLEIGWAQKGGDPRSVPSPGPAEEDICALDFLKA